MSKTPAFPRHAKGFGDYARSTIEPRHSVYQVFNLDGVLLCAQCTYPVSAFNTTYAASLTETTDRCAICRRPITEHVASVSGGDAYLRVAFCPKLAK
jgi:hypothetical protein